MKEKLLNLEAIYANSLLISDIKDIPEKIINHINLIGEYCEKRKGVYTVLATLLYYKYLHPEQDVRLFQTGFSGGFSARSFDTKYVTPVLKKLKLPAMAESGWLTRSMEQPYPYDYSYNGKIYSVLKIPFLDVLDFIEKNPTKAYNSLRILLNKVKEVSDRSVVKIVPLENPEGLTISKIMEALKIHFLTKYGTHNGAKLPVLAFHSIYTFLVKELSRYNGCYLSPLSSLTACDRTNKASGDIEIFTDDGELFEAIEIKLDKQIDEQIMRVVADKVYKWNPKRYYILSVNGIKSEDVDEINQIVFEIETKHGCQIIINGLLNTINYYLRLLENLDEFIKQYSKEIEEDNELQVEHKNKWNELLKKMNKG